VVLIAVYWVYMLATSVESAFSYVMDTTGLLFAIFYIMTALAMIVYYRRRVLGNVRDLLILGVLPLAAAGFLGWMFVETMRTSVAAQNWALVGIIGAGLVLLIVARFFLRSPFFQIPRESD
jgi:amino acid transporter